MTSRVKKKKNNQKKNAIKIRVTIITAAKAIICLSVSLSVCRFGYHHTLLGTTRIALSWLVVYITEATADDDDNDNGIVFVDFKYLLLPK